MITLIITLWKCVSSVVDLILDVHVTIIMEPIRPMLRSSAQRLLHVYQLIIDGADLKMCICEGPCPSSVYYDHTPMKG